MAVQGRYERAIAAIDAANAGDPHTLVVDGEVRPKEQAHAELMVRWVQRLDPEASEAQLLAARAHHLRRWSVPRSSYPEGRAGYLRWRTALRKQHADEVVALLEGAGYDAATIAEVQALIRKDRLGRHDVPAGVQVHEDALCLVFLQTQLAETTDRLGDDKMVDVIQKTAKKMSDRALAMVSELPIREHDRGLIAQALEAD